MADTTTERHAISETWRRFLTLHRLATSMMDQHLREAVGHGLDDYDVLHQVASHDGPIRMGELAEQMLIANSSCNRIVGRLCERGHLRRLTGVTDRRTVLVELTRDGRRLHRRMAAVHTRDIEQLLGDGAMSAAGRARLDADLERLAATLAAS